MTSHKELEKDLKRSEAHVGRLGVGHGKAIHHSHHWLADRHLHDEHAQVQLSSSSFSRPQNDAELDHAAAVSTVGKLVLYFGAQPLGLGRMAL